MSAHEMDYRLPISQAEYYNGLGFRELETVCRTLQKLFPTANIKGLSYEKDKIDATCVASFPSRDYNTRYYLVLDLVILPS